MAQQPSLPRPSDKWIPWYFVAFFVALIAVLVPMGIIAVRTNSGVVTENAYDKGLAYNKTIGAANAQEALGWHSDLSVTAGSQPDTAQVIFNLRDSSGTPIGNADVKVWLIRPTQNNMDQNALMKAQADGHYTASLLLPAHGLWEARISATAQDKNYQMTKRVTIP